MPAAPTLDMNRSPELEGPKLRSSCNGCGTAKVKCDRERPQCSRCSTLGLTCVYGQSRKFGKPPRKRLASESVSTIEKRIYTSTSQTTPHNRDKITAMNLGELQNTQEPVQHDFSHPAANMTLFSSEINTDLYPPTPFDVWPHLGEWPQLETFGTGLDFAPASPLERASDRSKIPQSDSHESHSCPRESYEIFRDLICPSPSLHAPESNSTTVSAQLDQVLQFNRNAIDRLSQLLKCPCAKSGHRAMVHASIVSRILIWYQQAAGWTGSSAWGPRPSASVDSSMSSRVSSSPSPQPPSRIAEDTSMTSPTSLVQATGFAVEHVPISIGAFSIEDQDVQAAFRNQLVLSELKKAADLIELFISISISISNDSGEPLASGLTGLYSHLGTWLKSEHSRTVNILRCRLRTLNKALES
ncbi:hypothetical protein BJ875DRAFT_472442 [Amylocarpus encephaloides]|uniref:Zn(2)-C6 fungal-type domain-containing protein n=1 Tax=Amylocarpus encephaloides TaxID=45428 RepID=A0A9P7YC43_9HELO|nr:hypothetical protein BJ875DRAFT_472442 [Amylocarpus encephaloides]